MAPRRRRWVATAVVFCGLAAAAGVAVGSSRLSVGSVITGGEASEGPPSGLAGPETIVATGESRVAGRWLVTSYTSEESASQPAGLPCLRMTLENPPAVTPMASSGFCGRLVETFGAASLPVVNEDGAAEVMIFGIAPRTADSVDLQLSTGPRIGARARVVDSSFDAARVFVLSAQRAAPNAGLSVRNRFGHRLARSIDASGFMDRLAQVQRSAPGR